MYLKEKLDLLLSDENFQDDILQLENSPEEGRLESILAKYSITEQEFEYAKRFLTGIAFRKEKLNSEDIGYALIRLRKRISNASLSPSTESGKKIHLITWISRVAAILFVPLLLTNIYFYQKSKDVQTASISSPSSKMVSNTFLASLGARTKVALPDGSTVWLNSGSSLSCPAVFDSESRNVELKGEAFFDVIKNEKVPMIVTTGNLKVKVYGTRFNVNAFPDEGTIETTLVEGKVTIIPSKSKTEYQLLPGYTSSYSTRDRNLQITKVSEMDVFTGWKEGKLLFRDEQFDEIIKKLERWYNVDIQLADASLGNYILYATFFDENIEQILNIFSGSIPIQIEYPKRIKTQDGTYAKRQIIIKRDTKRNMN